MTHHTGSDEGRLEVTDAIAAVLTEHEWSGEEDFCNCGHYVGSRMPSVHKWHLADILAARAAAPDALRGRVEALADEWAETDWNVTPHLGCLGMYRHCAELLRAALAERPTDGAGT